MRKKSHFPSVPFHFSGREILGGGLGEEMGGVGWTGTWRAGTTAARPRFTC